MVASRLSVLLVLFLGSAIVVGAFLAVPFERGARVDENIEEMSQVNGLLNASRSLSDETSNNPKFVALVLHAITKEYPDIGDLRDVTFDGDRYIYTLMTYMAPPSSTPRCRIVQVDTLSMLDTLTENSPQLGSYLEVWDFRNLGLPNCQESRMMTYGEGYLWMSINRMRDEGGAQIVQFDPSKGDVVSIYDIPVDDRQQSALGSIVMGQDGFVYLATGIGWIARLDPSNGDVSLIAISPGVDIRSLASNLPYDLLIDGEYFYYTGPKTPGVGRVGKDGSDPILFTHSMFDKCPCGTLHLVKGPSGKIWFTSHTLRSVGSLDPSNGKIIMHNLTVSSNGNRTHSLVWDELYNDGPIGLTFDDDGDLWMVGEFRIVEFNPVSGSFWVYDIPFTTKPPYTGYVVRQVILGPENVVWSFASCGGESSLCEDAWIF